MSNATRKTPPNPRAVASWYKSLRRLRPRALWLRPLELLRVEALARVTAPSPERELDVLILEELAAHADPLSTEALAEELCLEADVLLRLLARFQATELLSGEGGAWKLTEQGRLGAEAGEPPAVREERRTFFFETGAELPARYLPLENPPTQAVSQADPSFEPSRLCDLARLTSEEKRRIGFPLDVREIVTESSSELPRDRWQRIVTIRPERMSLLLVETEGGETLGYPVSGKGPRFRPEEPVLTLSESAAELFPSLEPRPTLEEWAEAWDRFGREQGWDEKEIADCEPKPDGDILRVTAPPRIASAVRKGKLDVWLAVEKNGTWHLSFAKVRQRD